jgi:AcrR family transcriptional regulator
VNAREPKDRRVARTQRLLRDALLALIRERGWDEVTVQDVCERADVGRSTFYVHFADKEELLLSGFELFRAQLRAHVATSPGEPFSFLRPLVEHVREHQQLSRALMGKRSHQAIQKEFLALVSDMVEADLAPRMPAGPPRSAVVRYVAGALSELLVWWLGGRTGLDATQIEHIAHTLCSAVLTADFKPRSRAR